MKEVESPVWQFRVQPIPGGPQPPRNIAPANRSVDLPARLQLDWSRSSHAETYDVLLGLVSPPSDRIVTTTESKIDIVAPLELGKTYYWQIVARSGDQRVEGPVWSFTTAAMPLRPNVPATPQPRDHAIVGVRDFVLAWENDPNADEYDVFLSELGSPAYVATVTEPEYAVQH
ncbi:MAG: hypothetical protein AB7N71_08305 [Phycisphaerae bacterium]